MPLTCAGLQFVGVRDLTPIEREMLSDRAESFRVRALLWLIATLLALPALIFALVVSFLGLSDYVSIPLILLSLCFCVWAPLKWRDASNWAKLAERAAAAQTVERFGGLVEDSAEAEPNMGQLLAAGLQLENPNQTIERNSASGEVLYINGVALVRPVVTQVSEVAEAPSTTNQLFPGIVSPQQYGSYPTRGLSSAELLELERLHRRLIPQLSWGEWIWGLYIIFMILGNLGRAGHQQGRLILVGFGLLMLGSLAVSYIKLYKWKVAIKKDLVTAVVVQIREENQDLEILPTSHAPWNINGRPAPWRHRMSLRRNSE